MTTPSAQYTYLFGIEMARVVDQVNEFCRKYPEYRLLQILLDNGDGLYAILTTDPY
jgi:hypothetical protein